MEERRLIDANELMDVIRQHEYRLATKQGSIDYGMFTLGIQQAVDEQPTIDAAPVVRCKDCKYCDISLVLPTGREMYTCMEGSHDHQMLLNPTDYCSYGVRKGEDNDD